MNIQNRRNPPGESNAGRVCRGRLTYSRPVTRRYLTATSRERLVVSRVVSSIGLGILALLGLLWSQDPQATIFQAAPFGLAGLALLAGAQLLARKHRQYLFVDFATRQATFVARGKDRWRASLDELGPIVCMPFERRRYRNGAPSEITEYQAVASGRKDLALQQSSGYPASRRFAVKLARQWGVGFRGLDGHVRKAQDLDQPLGPVPGKDALLDAESGVTVETREAATVLRSSVLPATSGLPDLFVLGGALFAWMAIQELHGPAVLSDPFFDPLRTAGVLLLSGIGAGAAAMFGYQVWRFLQPAALSVDDSHVRYRGRSIRISDVREVVSAGEILILGDHDHLAIPSDFCQPRADPPLVRAIQQLIALGAARERAASPPTGGA